MIGLDPYASPFLASGSFNDPKRGRHGYRRADAVAQPQEQRPIILIIDDDRAIRDALDMVLSDQGLDCLTAADGSEALALLETARRMPDLILLDLMMPGLNGWDFRQVQLRDPRLARIPTVVVSAAADNERANVLGIRHFLRKPVNLDAVLEVVQEILPDWRPAY